VIWLPATWFTAATILKVLAAVRALSPDVLEIPTNNLAKGEKMIEMSQAVVISCVQLDG
jgi:hypothetical protein